MDVVDQARTEWRRIVVEPPGHGAPHIDRYIRHGLGWHWVDPYEHNGQFAWCGAFAAWCWRRGVDLANRKRNMASTYRLWRWSGGRRGNERRIQPDDIQAGDIVVIGPRPSMTSPRRRPRWGKHITIALCQPDGGILHTIEGNATGYLPDMTRAEGVVRLLRPMYANDRGTYRVLYAVRPLPHDRGDMP